MLSKPVDMAIQAMTNLVKQYPVSSSNGPGYDSLVGGTGGDNARYGAVSASKSRLKSVQNFTVHTNKHPCHAYMSSYKNPIVVFNHYGVRPGHEEPAEVYLKWIQSDEGPWRSFENKSISHDWDGHHGWVWDDLTAPSNLQHNFLVASRMPAEWPSLIDQWFVWQSVTGVNPSVAFVMSDVFRSMASTGGSLFKLNFTNLYDWPLDVCTSGEKYVRNFLTGCVENLNKSYSESQNYRPVNQIFGKPSASIMTETYPRILYGLYHKTHGMSPDESKKFWTKDQLGFQRYDPVTHWTLTETEIVDICKRESIRLG